MLKSILVVFLGGGLGCVLRFLIGKGTLMMIDLNFPLGTFFSNAISCLLLAAIFFFSHSSGYSKQSMLFFITGFCGGLSTFSTFSFETFELIRQGHIATAILNISLSLIVGIGVMFAIYSKSTQ